MRLRAGLLTVLILAMAPGCTDAGMSAEQVEEEIQTALDESRAQWSEDLQGEIDSAVADALVEHDAEIRQWIARGAAPEQLDPFSGCAEYRRAVSSADVSFPEGQFSPRYEEYAEGLDLETLTAHQNYLLHQMVETTLSEEAAWEEFDALSSIAAPEVVRADHHDLLSTYLTYADLNQQLVVRLALALPFSGPEAAGFSPRDVSEAQVVQAIAEINAAYDAFDRARRLALADCPDSG